MDNIKSFDKFVSEMARQRDPSKPKKDFFRDHVYPQYDPQKSGYGNPDEWRRAFNIKMGYEEAVQILGDEDPYTILGVPETATPGEVKSAYRKRAMETHPDRNPDKSDEEFKKVVAAYTKIAEESGTKYTKM